MIPGQVMRRITIQLLLSLDYAHYDKTEKRYTVVPSRPMYRYYFEGGDRFDLFDFVLGDWDVSSWAEKHLTELIQSVALRAPEVLIGAPWGPAADIWNLGAAVLEMFRALRMFSGSNGGSYEVEQHLAEIVHLLGPFPADLLKKGDQELVGRVFDDRGNVKGRTPFVDRPNLTHEEFTTGLTQEERDEFVAFLRSAMTIDPAKRPSPEDLLRGPWLRALS
ncbi:kinase-like domain-containing protein [Apiospora arundinis]